MEAHFLFLQNNQLEFFGRAKMGTSPPPHPHAIDDAIHEK